MTKDKKLALASIAAGLLYGLLARLAFGLTGPVLGIYIPDAFFSVMSAVFIFLVPIVIGFVTIYIDQGARFNRWPHWVYVPWVPVLLCLGASLLLVWEGLICIILWVPLFMLLSSIGGLAAGWGVRWSQKKKIRPPVMVFVMLLPFMAAPLENQIPYATQYRTVHNQIEIDRDTAAIWDEIKEVPMITEEEHSFSLNHFIGFPRPLEAKLIGEGVGAIRHATFEGGVLFVETIRAWEPHHLLSFSIKADSEHIPPTTLDDHVKIGGEFFDVLDGAYRIEPLGENRAILHLTSHHRLSTHFNFYSGLWTDFIMGDIQEYILNIIKRRCESAHS